MIKGRGKLIILLGGELEAMLCNGAPHHRVLQCSQLRVGRIVKRCIQGQDRHVADLAITTDLNFLVVIPWVYQMMSFLEWNVSSVKKKILKKGKENVHNNK